MAEYSQVMVPGVGIVKQGNWMGVYLAAYPTQYTLTTSLAREIARSLIAAADFADAENEAMVMREAAKKAEAPHG